MYKHVLIATDGSELADKAVEHGLQLAKRFEANVTAVMVTEPWSEAVPGEMALGFPAEEYDKCAALRAERILSQVAKDAASARVPCDTIHVKGQFPATGIIETAKNRGCDLIVMASHGRRGVSRLLLGSQANAVVTHSSVPVLICR